MIVLNVFFLISKYQTLKALGLLQTFKESSEALFL